MLSVFATLGGKVAIGLLAGGAAVVGGTAVAAYADLLPATIQQAAHDSIGAPVPGATASAEPTDAPTPTPTTTPTSSSVGPDATGPAAFGLCTAFTHGGLNVSSTAYASLASAANGASNIATYCSTITKPGPTGTHAPNSHSNGNSPHTHVPSPGSTHKPAPGTHP
ncbi:MAG: hypothetical protein QOH69_804 [Actinomycetota bacterium]|jgi:hypothetical protein|nr:hypothetical protein [Actinomycetota bacterium]MDQ1551932.1 hypothetical protein [Actinomycetota bacterium]